MPRSHDLSLPDPPDRVDVLGSPPDALVHAGPAGHRVFLASSPRVQAHGTEWEGLRRVVVPGGALLDDLRTEAGPCSNVLVGPRSVRRELVGPGGTVLETLLTADRHPALLVQWITPSPGPLALDVRWRVPGVAEAQRSSGPVLRVRPEEGPDRLFAVLPGPARWGMEVRSGALGVRVRVRAEDGPVTLMVAGLDPADDGTGVLRTLARAAVLDTRAEAFIGRVREELLATRTGVPEIDDGLAWAVARTVGTMRPHRPFPHDPLGRLWMAVGSLATGDRDAAGHWAAPEPVDAAGVLALGWWVRWTAGLSLLKRHREAALDVLSRGDVGTSSLPRPVHQAARTALARALEAAGDEEAAARVDPTSSPRPGPGGLPPGRRTLTAAHEPERAETPEDPGGMALPMIDGPGTVPLDQAILAAVLGSSGRRAGRGAIARDPRPSSGPHRALRAWALYAIGRPDDAYPLLRDHMAEGLRGAVGLWPPNDGGDRTHDPVAAALLPAVVLHGLLGARAEAPWGRLRLAPALPPPWSRFQVGGIRVADARVSLGYARREGIHTFTVEQTTGRVPLTLVFEPSVPGRVDTVRVDDRPAELTIEARGGRSRARLQIPLDAQRTVTLVASPP